MKKKLLSFIFLVCLIIPCVILVGCKEEKDKNPSEPVNEVKVMLSDDGKTLYRFAPDNVETEYTVPEGVEIISSSAFENCDNLTKVVLPSTLEYIQEEAFFDCDNLTTVEINSDISIIGEESFRNCRKLATIDTSKIVSYSSGLTSARNAFYNCDSLTGVTIAKEVTYLPTGVFSCTDSLKTVNFELNSSLLDIGIEAFSMSSIESINIPETCKYIGTSAFSSSGLTSITIGKNITRIGSSAFYNCDKLLTVEFETGRTENLEYRYGYSDTAACIFYGCDSLVSVINYSMQSSIPTEMFSRCLKLENITFSAKGEGYVNVNEQAFYQCESLREINLPNEYKYYICREAFAYCYSLENITLDASKIDYRAFYKCYSLKDLNLRAYNVESCAFEDCSSLSKLIINDGSVKINDEAFNLCTALFEIYNLSSSLELTLGEGIATYARDIYTSLDTASKIKSLNNVIYYDNGTDFVALAPTNRNVESIEFDSKTTEVNIYAFYDLHKLNSVTIQEETTKIGNGAFRLCSKLKTVVINNGTISDNLVKDDSNGYLVYYANIVYIKTGLDTTNSTYLLENFTKQATSDKSGYDMYVRNAE